MKQGIYEEIVSEKMYSKLQELEEKMHVDREKIDLEESKSILSKYIKDVTKRALSYLREGQAKCADSEILIKQIQACNKIIEMLSSISNEPSLRGFEISEQAEVLLSLYDKINSARSINKNIKAIRPVTSISENSLFTGSSTEPDLVGEFRREILSCDSIDMLVSFIKWSGIRLIIDEIREFAENRGKKLRIITTSYMAATDFKAVEELGKIPNVEIKVSYDTERTRLHAKAYMFKRETGFTTAYIGSSNISNPALTSGLEWNMKVSEKDSFDIIKKFEAAFESYWNDAEFIAFNGDDEAERNRLMMSLKKDKDRKNDLQFMFDIKPYYYQKEILEKLEVERSIFGRYKNLIVAATGVGKTVISAFDYRRFCEEGGGKHKRLLFVAHRQEILKQSRDTFRGILKDANFGELMVGANKPQGIDHLFVSIQSFNSSKLYEKTSEDFYDYIVVDEFHHAEAPSYKKLLEYYKPKILLGLTATPERMDGRDILHNFDDRIAAEMRLTEAVDRKLLSPFQYFCVSDTVDISKLKWSRKGYDTNQLSNVYTDNNLRSIQILKSLYKYSTDVDKLKGIGFCVSVKHAEYMAGFFNDKGIESAYLHGKSSDIERDVVKSKLAKGDIKFVFVVDLYNEGVDIKEVNTILFLRPTESLTVFLQQLGRGLRLHDEKECLTVLDFVGQAHSSYDFSEKFKALMGTSRRSLRKSIEDGFLNLPKGCYIKLEKQAREYILRSIEKLPNTSSKVLSKIRSYEEDTGEKITLEGFLEYNHMKLIDLYGAPGKRNFSRMMQQCNLKENFADGDEESITKRLKNLFHINSRRWITFILSMIDHAQLNGNFESFGMNEEQILMRNMFYYTFYGKHPEKMNFESIEEGVLKLIKNAVMIEEIRAILNYNYNKIDFMDEKVDIGHPCPLDLHCRYTRDQILAALGDLNEEKSPALQAGVKHFKDRNLDAFFITLNKSEKEFSPSTLYDDYAINDKLFHWQSQSTTSLESPTGMRYINHRERESNILLFVREAKKQDGITGNYMYLGKVDYVSHSGNRPISFVWKLQRELPAGMVKVANKSII